MKRWLVMGAVVLALLLIVGAGYLGLRGARRPGSPSAAGFEPPSTVQVTRGVVQQTVIAPGLLVETQGRAVSARLAGDLFELRVRPGDTVRAGDVLARLRVDDLRQAIVAAEDELRAAQLALEAASSAHRRELAQAKLDLAAAQAEAARARSDRSTAIAQAERAIAAERERRAGLQARSAEHAALVAIAGVERTRAEEEQARAQVAYLEALDRPWEEQRVRDAHARAVQQAEQDLAVAQARVDQARAALAAHRHDLNLQDQAIAGQEAELARLRAQAAPLLRIRLERARQELAWLEQGLDPLLADRVDRARRDLERLQARLAGAEVTAPIDGVVLETAVRVGDAVVPGSTLLTIADPRAVEARTTVIEEDLPLVEAGLPAELYFDAQPEAMIEGKVARIVPRRVPGEDRPLYPVYLAPVEALPERLYAGMTVDASIIVDRRQDVLRLPRAVARARSDGTAQVRVWAGGRAEARTVRVGLRGDVYVEILEGLREGEEVLAE